MKAEQLLFAATVVFFSSATSIAAQQTQPDARLADLRQRQAEFREMDRDNNDVITRAEWRGNRPAFRRYDLNRDGMLSGDEIWVDRGRGRGRNRDLDRYQASFTELDGNRNGVITSGEWRGPVEDFQVLDLDRDGVLTQQEYGDRRDLVNSAAYRAGRDRGTVDGREAGRQDKNVNGGRWDLDGQRELERADAGYLDNMGPRADYQTGYRAGFRAGYREGFGPR